MRLVLDACVIFPTIMREILIGCASARLFEPQWSERIIEEWLHAAEKLGGGARAIAAAEAAVMKDQFPEAMVGAQTLPDIWLPDANDIHVLETAINGAAPGLLTVNTKDFPLRILRDYDLGRFHPDPFLVSLAQEHSDVVRIAQAVQQKAETISGRPQTLRSLLKRTGLPRLGKFLAQG